MERDDVFETSDCQLVDNVNEDVEENNNSGCSSKEEFETAWAKFPVETKELVNETVGILYMDRFESFLKNNWPYDVKRGNLCHPRALALAGLAFCSLQPGPSAQCVVCRKVLSNLEPNSNPWILHSEINPDCHLVQLGQRDKVDDYTMDEVLHMVYLRVYNETEVKLIDNDIILKKQLAALRKHELDLGIKN